MESIVSEELGLLQRVAEYLCKAVVFPTETNTPAYHEDMIALRNQIAEARLEDVPPLVAQMLHLSALMQSKRPNPATLVDANSPYFGHLQIREKNQTRDVLIGKQTVIDRDLGLSIVDWRHAPVSRLYYCYHEGDDFEEDFAGKTREGFIVKRRSLSISEGQLKRIRCPQGIFVLEEHTWKAIQDEENHELKGGAGVAARPLGTSSPFREDKRLSEITALIDPVQFDAMTQSNAGVVVLQGGAGSGKTTILLHRIAYLAYANPDSFRAKHILVVVFSEALASYVKQVLPSLGLHGVRVMDYQQWVEHVLGQCVDRQDRRRVHEAPIEVSALKKHPAILIAIKQQLQRRRTEFERETGMQVNLDKPLAIAIRDIGKKHPHLEKMAKRHFEKVSDIISEWEELITDEELLKGIPDLEIALRWTRKQIETPDTYAHIDADRRTAMDQRSIDADDPIFAFDPHDGPILLNLYEARFGSALHYDHIAVDEAQDLSPVELKPLLTSLQENQSMTLAGDVAQKVVFDNSFEDWSTLLRDIGATGIQVEPFQISYRSTKEIMEFSQNILGPLKPAISPKAIRVGAPVDIFEFDEVGEEIAFLAEQLRNLMAREREANVAILTRYPERADFYYEQFKKAEVPFCRRAQKSTFAFAPGIDVTHIAEAKGLEFDYVIIPEATRFMYPDQIESRHLLHIAATRAAYQLWLTTSSKNRSPIIPKAP